MSYIAYINGFEVELSDIKPIALTKQVNDIARLDNRQSNFSNKITLPFTAKNIRAMKNLNQVGNTSNTPYIKNTFDLIDANSGKHIVYKGWCNVGQTTSKGYEINTYDGIIDFYKLIENRSLTDIGISDLSHVKVLTNIVNSWNDTYAYKYIIADYNGKLYTSTSNLNADYLIPSARISYLFDRVHNFAGFTYNGNIFNTERFLNFFMTFPKPIPTTEPIVTNITTQTSTFATGGYGGGGGLYFFNYGVNFFPTAFSTTDANNSTNANIISINTTGAYRITCNGQLTFPSGLIVKNVDYRLVAPDNSIITSGVIDASINQNVVINATAGNKLNLSTLPLDASFVGSFDTTLDLITGYSANFDDALVDFKATDFVNEIMRHFGLTAFKDEYTNHIEYLTLDEILQNTDIIDWSDKFVSKNSEKYAYSNFAKRNNFKYKYNDNNLRYNDGAIFIDNENLKDETTIIASKFFTPEQQKTIVLTNETNVYKFWDKVIKDDLTIDYKPLSGRYYSLRSVDNNFGSALTLQSELLGTSITFTTAPIESYYRLKQQQIIYDNYATIESILDNAKVLDATFYLNPLDYESFDFKKLIYVRQLASYYQVNKINNFVPTQPTKVELIEVDYFKELEIPEPMDYVFQVNNDILIDYTSCVATFAIFTDIPLLSNVEIIPYCLTADAIGGVFYAPYPLDTPIIISLTSTGSISYNFSQLPEMVGGWKFKFRYATSVFSYLESNLTNILNITNSCYFPVAPTINLSYITITNIETISIDALNGRTVRITYISDLTTGRMNLTAIGTSLSNTLPPSSANNMLAYQNGTIDISFPNFAISGGLSIYSLQLNALGVFSNTVIS